MRTATRGAAALIVLGALVAQAPLAGAYEPREPWQRSTGTADVVPVVEPSSAPSARPTATPTETPTIAPAPDPTADPPGKEVPVARSWSELVKHVAETSPSDPMLRATAADQSTQVMRCFRLEEENYCLGLGFVDKIPTGAQISETVSAPSTASEELRANASTEQDLATGALTPAQFVAARVAMPKSLRMNAELEEMQAAWDGRDKARALRLLDADGNPPAGTEPGTPGAAGAAGSDGAPGSTGAPGSVRTPMADGTSEPKSNGAPEPGSSPQAVGTPQADAAGSRGAEASGSGASDAGAAQATPTPGGPTTKPSPPPLRPPAATKPLPASNYIMKGYQTSQEKSYWCGPATFQSIDWADDNQKDTQASWAKDLGVTTSGTAITALVKQTNLKTNWDIAAGTYIVQNVSHWNTKKFFQVHQKHLGDGAPAPVIEHVQLLKRYFPYLAFNHSGHYQVGRGYNRTAGTIGIFEVFNERRFNSRGNVTHGAKNIPASALFNATLANQFKNIGL